MQTMRPFFFSSFPKLLPSPTSSLPFFSTRPFSVLSSSSTSSATPPIVVLGAGIAGLSCAHFLLRSFPSSSVVVVDKHPSVASGASRKNGALLCPSLDYPWTGASLFDGEDALLPRGLYDDKFPVRIRASAIGDRQLFRFGMGWLLRKKAIKTANEPIGELMRYSMRCMDDPLDDVVRNIEYGRFGRGTKKFGESDVNASDSSGDIKLFCEGLAESMLKTGRLKLMLNTDILSLSTSGRLVTGVSLSSPSSSLPPSVLSGSSYVVSLGTGSYKLCEGVGVPCPIYPVKGYLATFTSRREVSHNFAMRNKTFVAPIGRVAGLQGVFRYRVSGFAEFVKGGEENKLLPELGEAGKKRVDELVAIAREEFPDLTIEDVDCGYRPLSPDDTPLIGGVGKLDNLFLCTGHGSKGWTMGLGSGKLVADIIAGRKTDIDRRPYDPGRFFFYAQRVKEPLKTRAAAAA